MQNMHVPADVSVIKTDRSYPEISIPTRYELPIEIFIYSFMPPGSADAEIAYSHQMQLQHPTYTNIFFEASAKVFNTAFNAGENTAVYTFLVGDEDLEFHRHEGHRIIIGMTGSAGAVFRFSDALPEEELSDPIEFAERMHVILMPPDSRFVLRFSGKVYHQFGPLSPSSPAVWAISVHPDEAGGLEGELLKRILNDEASIPILTEPLSQGTQEAIRDPLVVQTYATWHRFVRPEQNSSDSTDAARIDLGDSSLPGYFFRKPRSATN